jgi:hypothetical protein
MIPTFGVSKDGTSNVNTVSRLIYAYIRHANSGSRNYEAADYMTYLLAMSSLYAYHAEMMRVYGILRVYNRLNRYVAKHILESMEYDYEDIVSHIADLRYYINYFAVKLNAFAVPKDMHIFDRHAALPLMILKDSDQDKAQLYIPQFEGYYTWSATAYDTGSALVYTRYLNIATATAKANKTFASIKTFGDSLLAAMLSNEDIGIMSGDTLKAYGNEGCRVVSGITEDFSVLPIYDEMMLSQVHNIDIVGSMYADGKTVVGNMDWKQDNGSLVWSAYVYKEAGSFMDATSILDCQFDNPSVEYNMEASRFKAKVNVNDTATAQTGPGETTTFYGIGTCGSEIVTSVQISTIDDATGKLRKFNVPYEVVYTSNSVVAYLISYLQGVSYKSMFDFAPLSYFKNDYSSTDADWYIAGELFNYATIDVDLITKLHNVALYSMLEVPNMGKEI